MATTNRPGMGNPEQRTGGPEQRPGGPEPRPGMSSPDRGTQQSQSTGEPTGMQKLRDQGKEMLESAGDAASQAKHKIQEVASDVMSQVRDKTQEFASVATEKAEDLGRDLANLIRRYPIPGLLIGFTVGLFLGRMSRT